MDVLFFKLNYKLYFIFSIFPSAPWQLKKYPLGYKQPWLAMEPPFLEDNVFIFLMFVEIHRATESGRSQILAQHLKSMIYIHPAVKNWTLDLHHRLFCCVQCLTLVLTELPLKARFILST